MRLLVAEGLYFVSTLREMGHEVLTIGNESRERGAYDIALSAPVYARDLTRRLDALGFAPDAFIWCDRSDMPFVFGHEQMPWVTAGFTIDHYCHPWHVPFSWGFDLLLCAQKSYLPLFEQERKSAAYRWFPLFHDGREPALPGERDIPVSFVGTLHHPNNPDRAPFLAAFKRRCPLVTATGDFRAVFGRSRIVLNQSAVGEVNFRVFEAAACGAALLTEQGDNGLEELFVPGEEILRPYPRGDAERAAATAREALADPQRLERVAARGLSRARREHGISARCRTLVAALEELAARKAWQGRLEGTVNPTLGLRTAFAFLAAELPPADPLHGLYSLLARTYGLAPETLVP